MNVVKKGKRKKILKIIESFEIFENKEPRTQKDSKKGIKVMMFIVLNHREITIIELQSLVVFGCTALHFMVGATVSTHDREEGWDNFLFVYTE